MDFTKLIDTLEHNGFSVKVFETADEAADYLDKEIDNTTVGQGGSLTVRRMGIMDRLAKHNTLWSHWNVPEGMNQDEVLAKAMTTEVYLSSVNGLAETGEIINIDGTGNRVASCLFGHKRLYYVVGKNKIAPTYEEALWRARNIAAPLNAKRLERKTPCAVDGKCHDCNSPDRICRGLTVTWKAMKGMQTEVILINEELGL